MNETTVRIKTYDGRVIEQTHRTNPDDAIKATVTHLVNSQYVNALDIKSVWIKDNHQHWLENWSQVTNVNWPAYYHQVMLNGTSLIEIRDGRY